VIALLALAAAEPAIGPDGLTPLPIAAPPSLPVPPEAAVAAPAPPPEPPPSEGERGLPLAGLVAALGAGLAAATTTRIRSRFPAVGLLPVALDGTATAARLVLVAAVIGLLARVLPTGVTWVVPLFGLAAALGLVWSVRDALPSLVAWVARGSAREPVSAQVQVSLALPGVPADRARVALRGAVLASPWIATAPAIEVGTEPDDPQRWRVRATLADARWGAAFSGSFAERVHELLAATPAVRSTGGAPPE
jgi:hypothetical protein